MTAAPKKPFKIKVLPKNEPNSANKKKQSAHIRTSRSKAKKGKPKDLTRFLFLLLAGIALAGLYFVNTQRPQKPKDSPEVSAADQKLTKYLQDAQKKSDLKKLQVEVENINVQNGELPAFLPLDTKDETQKRPLGVELESDRSMERIYDDLYGKSTTSKFMTPEERISARIAQKQWLYEYEIEERKMYIRNFIKAAKEAGYDIKINEDLIVTEVTPIVSRPKVPLDKVLEDLRF